VRGEIGERMMIAWFPGAREGVTGIDRVFGMHLTSTPWADITEAIAAAKGQ
jgi:hypothetical protein